MRLYEDCEMRLDTQMRNNAKQSSIIISVNLTSIIISKNNLQYDICDYYACACSAHTLLFKILLRNIARVIKVIKIIRSDELLKWLDLLW